MSYSKNPAVQRVLAKVASMPPPPVSWWKRPEVLGTVAAAVVPFALAKAWGGGEKLLSMQRKSKAFKDTLEMNPHLKRFPSKSTQRYFSTLYRVNPEMAQDPTVAGAFIQNQHELGDPTFPNRGIIPGVSEMAKIRKDMHGLKARPTFAGAGATAGAGAKEYAKTLAEQAQTRHEAQQTLRDLEQQRQQLPKNRP